MEDCSIRSVSDREIILDGPFERKAVEKVCNEVKNKLQEDGKTVAFTFYQDAAVTKVKFWYSNTRGDYDFQSHLFIRLEMAHQCALALKEHLATP